MLPFHIANAGDTTTELASRFRPQSFKHYLSVGHPLLPVLLEHDDLGADGRVVCLIRRPLLRA